MKANALTLSRKEAVKYLNRTRRSDQIYMYKFDVDCVFRKGKLDDEQIGKVRYKEDAREQKIYNSRTKSEQDKKNDIVTYKVNGSDDLYVLPHSGGVSLFDGMRSKVRLGKKDCWWIIKKNARPEDGLVIAKDIFIDKEGNTHCQTKVEMSAFLPSRDVRFSFFTK